MQQLGPIHLVSSAASHEAEAAFYCGVQDAIAAIHPFRLKDFPAEMICPDCLRAHEAILA